MKVYNIEYKIGGYGCINIDVEMDIPRDHPEFMGILNDKAEEIVKNALLSYGVADFIHTEGQL